MTVFQMLFKIYKVCELSNEVPKEYYKRYGVEIIYIQVSLKG